MYEYASSADSSGGVACPAGTQRRQPAVFSRNLPLSLRGHGENRRDETAPKRGTAEDFFFRWGAQCAPFPCLYAVPDTLLLHMRFRFAGATYPCRATLWHVARKAPADLGIRYNLSAQALSVITRKRIVRHCYPPGDLLLPFGQFTLCRTQRRTVMCSSNRSDSLRICGCEMGVPLARPCGR